MSQALYRKWRPGNWEEVVGQQHIVQTIRNAVAAGKVGHAYLFAGPRGTGKTSLARILAKSVNCLADDQKAKPCNQCDYCLSLNQGSFLDLIEIDAASNTSVEDVRDLRDKINFSPNQGQYKVYIIDEVHMLSTAAFNALLKTLEEPPQHAIFVLATTEVHKIPATVLSRCQRHEFRRISVNDLIKQLEQIAIEEEIQVEQDALNLIARQAAGGMRDAISLLDQLSTFGKKITLEAAQTILGTATNQVVLQVVDALVAKDAAAGLNSIHGALDGGSDPRQLARQIVDYLRHVMLVRMENADRVDSTAEERAKMAEHAKQFKKGNLLRVIRLFNQAATETRGIWQPSLPLEMAFVESIQDVNEAPPITESKPSARPKKTAHVKPKAEDKSPAPPAGQKPGKHEQAVMDQWGKIFAKVREDSPNTTGLLNSSKREFREGILYLYFTSDLLKEKMESDNHLKAIQNAIRDVVGHDMDVRCGMMSGSGKGELPPGVDPSGMVATGLRMGGEIVDANDLGIPEEE